MNIVLSMLFGLGYAAGFVIIVKGLHEAHRLVAKWKNMEPLSIPMPTPKTKVIGEPLETS
jgi:hypothetical protein